MIFFSMFTALKSYFNVWNDLVAQWSAVFNVQHVDTTADQQWAPSTLWHTLNPRPATSQNVPRDAALAWALQTVSLAPPNGPALPSLPPPFLEASPGETVQRLNRSILIHDTTFEQKTFLYSFIKEQKQKTLRERESEKEREKSWVSVLHSDWCVPPPQGGGGDTCKWRRRCVCRQWK